MALPPTWGARPTRASPCLSDPGEQACSVSFDLQILISTGASAPEKVVLGLASALAAVHSELKTCVVLAMRGAEWAAESVGNEAEVPGYPPIAELIEGVQEAGGSVLGCSSCIDQYCPAPTGDDGLKVLREGIGRVGLSEVTLRMVQVPTVTF